MNEVIEHNTSKLTDEDRDALAAFFYATYSCGRLSAASGKKYLKFSEVRAAKPALYLSILSLYRPCTCHDYFRKSHPILSRLLKSLPCHQLLLHQPAHSHYRRSLPRRHSCYISLGYSKCRRAAGCFYIIKGAGVYDRQHLGDHGRHNSYTVLRCARRLLHRREAPCAMPTIGPKL